MAVLTPPSGKEGLNKMPAPLKNEANSLIVKMGPAKTKARQLMAVGLLRFEKQLLLLHHFDLAGIRVIVEFRSVRRRWQFAHIIRHQFIQVFGQTAFLRVE